MPMRRTQSMTLIEFTEEGEGSLVGTAQIGPDAALAPMLLASFVVRSSKFLP